MTEGFTTEYQEKYIPPRTAVYGQRSTNGDGVNKWHSRGGDSYSMSFYTTEYSSHYTRPQTTATGVATRGVSQSANFSDTPITGSGYGSNNHVSPLELTALNDREIYRTTTSHNAHSQNSTVHALMRPRTMERSTMERSGYWNEPMPNVLYDSPEVRKQTRRTREINPTQYTQYALKRMKQKNQIDAENNGLGPDDHSTAYGAAYTKHRSNHDRYWETDRSLIGKKEQNGFTRQHLTIHEDNIADMRSTTHAVHCEQPLKRPAKIPQRTVLESSGFARSEFPTMSRYTPLSDISASQLHPVEVDKLRHKDTTQYQNLYNPNPYVSTAHISYQDPAAVTRATTAVTTVRRGPSGYGHNEHVTAGAPGDHRTFVTGKTTYYKGFKDPQLGFRGRREMTANVVERSGFWGSN